MIYKNFVHGSENIYMSININFDLTAESTSVLNKHCGSGMIMNDEIIELSLLTLKDKPAQCIKSPAEEKVTVNIGVDAYNVLESRSYENIDDVINTAIMNLRNYNVFRDSNGTLHAIKKHERNIEKIGADLNE